MSHRKYFFQSGRIFLSILSQIYIILLLFIVYNVVQWPTLLCQEAIEKCSLPALPCQSGSFAQDHSIPIHVATESLASRLCRPVSQCRSEHTCQLSVSSLSGSELAVLSERVNLLHKCHRKLAHTHMAQIPSPHSLPEQSPPQTLPAHCFSESLELGDQERQFGIFLKLGSWQQEQIRGVPEILVRALEKQRPQTQVLLLYIHAPAHLTDDSKGHWRKWTVM